MAEFILGSPLRPLARRYEPLRKLLWRLDYGMLWTLEKVLQLLPVDLSSRLGARIGGLAGPLMRSKNKMFRDNYAVAFPALSDSELDALVHAAWRNAGRVLGEYPHLNRMLADPDRLQIEIRHPIPVFADTAQPFVAVAAHLANWEVIGLALARLGIPNASLYSPPTNPLLDKMLLASRNALNCELVPRDNSARRLMRALQKGRSVGVIVDRRVSDGHPIRFFGHDKESSLIPARLALKFNSDLTPIEVQRTGDARYRVIFHPPITPTDSGADDSAQAVDMTQQLHQLFETWIRENPTDWFCSKRMWSMLKKGKIPTPEESGTDADIDSYAA